MITKREFLMIHELMNKELSISEIARRLGLNRKTVRKYLQCERNDLTQPWVQMRLDELDGGDMDALLAAFSGFSKHHHTVVQAIGYFRNNAKRMRYREFRAQGLCVSSGVLEAGCKTAIAERLKQAGMHWTVNGANAIATLRCCVLSNRFDDFWYRMFASQ